jgi:anthranilate phosphoribosyltransferase
MLVEDTPHRVYIHDLAAELSDIESDEENPIFLSDIEKHLSKIPRHILLGPPPKPTEQNQMVLYNVPTSLTVPEEQDNVRKAIVEARQRIREKQASAVTEPERITGTHGMEDGVVHAMDSHEEDPDAMDLD